jgi:hypothetical protein
MTPSTLVVTCASVGAFGFSRSRVHAPTAPAAMAKAAAR